MNKRFIILFFLATMCVMTSLAKSYTVKKGGTLNVKCTATPPAGYITHTFYELVDPNDAQYLGMSYSSSDQCVTYYGLNAKSNIKVEVTYAYSYRGTYDNDMHVGHGTYYDYITVTGAPNATGINIREGAQISMRPGQTVTLHADLIPSNSEGFVDWGFIDAFGSPYNFKVTSNTNGTEVYVTGVREGQTMMMAWINNDQKTIKNITLKCTNSASVTTPESLSLTPSTAKIKVGESLTIVPQFSPSNAYSELSWASSNPDIATVDNKGQVKGLKAGTISVNASTTNGLVATSIIKIIPELTDFITPTSITMYKGYKMPIEYSFVPESAEGTLSWHTSNSSALTISSEGTITAKEVGTYTIEAKNSKLGKSKTIEIRIIDPPLNKSFRQANTRLEIIKSTINEILKNK